MSWSVEEIHERLLRRERETSREKERMGLDHDRYKGDRDRETRKEICRNTVLQEQGETHREICRETVTQNQEERESEREKREVRNVVIEQAIEESMQSNSMLIHLRYMS